MNRQRKRSLELTFAIILFVVFMAGCSQKDGLPSSAGQPYKVLVVAPDSQSATIVTRILSAPMQGLPQEESLFDVTYCNNSRFGLSQRLLRSIVTIDIDSTRHDKVEIRYEHDKDASPQIIIHLNSPSKKALSTAMEHGTGGTKLMSLLLRHEEAIQKRFIDEHRNTKMEQTVKRMFGIDIHLPANMQASKTSKDFLWIADNSGTTMQSLCIFKGTKVDSMLQANIQGEQAGMHMVIDGDKRGLWEMKGDAMGGPYIMETLTTHDSGPITLFAFVYAPGHEKRLLIRRLEAIIKSTSHNSDKENKNKQ